MPHTRISFLAALLSVTVSTLPAIAQASQAALRFYGAGAGQQDRVRIRIDDNQPGPDASAPCDVGAAGFTIDFWLRGTLADNPTARGGGDREYFDFRWIDGNTIVDRDIFGASFRDWGISLAGGYVRFGTGRADVAPLDGEHTIEGNVNVLDGQWRHVACVRDATTGVKSIYVDGRLDYACLPGRSREDLSYPNDGDPAPVTPWGPFIVLGAEKHDAGSAYPSFRGYMDEFRVWNAALTSRRILDVYDRVIAADTPGLVGYYRFEEGGGTSVADSSAAGSPAGQLIAGTPGNGEWVTYAANPSNTAPVSSGPLPVGFARETLVTGLNEPTVLEFLPSGDLLIGSRFGRIDIYRGGQLLPAPLIQIPVDFAGGERGLVGLTLDPDFATNGYFYVYYTTPEPRNVVSRFTKVGDTAAIASEFRVWQNHEIARDYHHGGTIRILPDGNLYIATGDQFDSGTSQPLSTQHGKILRVRRDGTIPPDNPYAGGPGGARPEIWARGVRNPFRFSYDGPTGRFFIGDVGGNAEDSWEEINLLARDANYGWPNQEGPRCYVSDCSAYVFPLYSYQHNDPAYFSTQSQGSITLGPVYRFTGGSGAFPPQYRENLFFGDYANRWIRRLVLDSSGNFLGDPLFLRSPGAGTIVDLEIGPDGALYYLTIGVPWSGDPDVPALHRVRFTGGGNQPPIAIAAATPTSGPAPLTVNFSSAGSSDPDSGPGPLTYSWSFGDGGSSTQPNPSHTYLTRGAYTARLTLNDGAASTTSAPLTITVGAPPSASIDTPAIGTTYRAGDIISFSGSASDPDGPPPPPSAFTWQVVLVHAAHTHPHVGPISGVTGGSFEIEATGHSPENTYYQIRLQVRDGDGLVGVATRDIYPVVSPLAFSTTPPGIPVFIDGEAFTTPRTFESLVGFQHTIEAQATFVIDGVTYGFQRWTDGAPRIRSFTAPEGGAALAAIYGVSGPTTVTVSVPANNRNADYYSAGSQQFANPFDELGLCCGRDGGGHYQIGLQFALPVPRAATIAQANIEMIATADQQAVPPITISGYDVGSAPAFIAGSTTPLHAFAPLTSAAVAWTPPAFLPAQTHATPELRAIVQEVVARGDWNSGNVIGFVLDGRAAVADSWRCIRNFASGQPARLVVRFSVPDPCAGLIRCDANCSGTVDFNDIDAFVIALVDQGAYAASHPACSYLCHCDTDGDGAVTFNDIDDFVACLVR